MSKFGSNYREDNASGSALVYILIAIALLAALTVSFMEPSGQQSQNQNSTRVVSDIYNQASLIQSAIQECVLLYPSEDNGLTSDEQKHSPYPITPADSYFDDEGATDGSASDNNVSNIRCPGNPGGSDPDHSFLFSGSSGKFLPQPPSLFEDWEYYNGDDGVFFFIQTDKSDPFLRTALEKVDDKFSECEADIIDATSGDVALSSDSIGDSSVRECPSGSRCFRVWMIIDSATNHGDVVDCP